MNDLNKLAEWAGFKQKIYKMPVYSSSDAPVEYTELTGWEYPDGSGGFVGCPPPDFSSLDAIFKHLIPNVDSWTMGSCPDGDICAVVAKKGVRGEVWENDAAIALCQAILKLIHSESKDATNR